MARQQICRLSYNNAINAIAHTSKVHFKRGIWNSYQLIDTAEAIKRINGSGYGADVYVENGEYYVSCPVDSDMW